MPTTLAIRFPLGRYHATPWDRNVNEGATEWPPSPWRLLRALAATWYARWPDLPAPELDALLDSLGDPPSYRTPDARPGHSRHYLPDLDHKKGEPGGTDLTLDPFLSVPRSDELLVRWDAELSAGQRGVLAKLAELLPYLGRADSICEARLLDSNPEPDYTWWRPGAVGELRARLLCPARPVSRPALEISTVEVRRSRRTLPMGAVMVSYAAEARPAGRPPARPEEPAVEALRFAVTGPVPLRATHGILLADDMHREVGERLTRADVDDERRQLLLGTGGARSDHQHVHWIPIADHDRRGASVRALVVWVPCMLRSAEVAAIIRRSLTLSGRRGGRDGTEGYELRGFPQVRLLFQAAGSIEQVAPELCQPSRRWSTLTPYLPVRHRKKEPLEDYLAADVVAELRYRDPFKDLPAPVVTQADPSRGLLDRRAREFRRYRLNERMNKARLGLDLRLEFATEVSGPLLLGQLSHFGYGIFRPE